jgi:hypothetical protein
MNELLIRAGLLVAVAATSYHMVKTAYKAVNKDKADYYGGKPANRKGKLTMDDERNLFW